MLQQFNYDLFAFNSSGASTSSDLISFMMCAVFALEQQQCFCALLERKLVRESWQIGKVPISAVTGLTSTQRLYSCNTQVSGSLGGERWSGFR